jgi:hypothetical protein
MPRVPNRLLVPVLLVVLFVPALAAARAVQKNGVHAASKRPIPEVRILSRLQGLLSALWAETGSILEPNGSDNGTSSSSGTKPTSDNGSGPEPNS